MAKIDVTLVGDVNICVFLLADKAKYHTDLQ